MKTYRQAAAPFVSIPRAVHVDGNSSRAVDPSSVFEHLTRRWIALTVAAAAVCLATASESVAQERAGGGSPIYQQRTPDGRIVLTDRPETGSMTQRTWQTHPDDADATRERREQARLESIAVHRRIQYQLDRERQRDHESALARLQLAKAEANLAAERVRAEAATQAVVVFVPSFARRPFPRPPHIPRPAPPRPRLSVQPSVAMVGAVAG